MEQHTEGRTIEEIRRIFEEKTSSFWRNHRYSSEENGRIIGEDVFTADFIMSAEKQGKSYLMEEYAGETLAITYKRLSTAFL